MPANELTDAFGVGSSAGQGIVNAIAQRSQFAQQQSLAQQRLAAEMQNEAFNRDLAQRKFGQELTAYNDPTAVAQRAATLGQTQANTGSIQSGTTAQNIANTTNQTSFDAGQANLHSILAQENEAATQAVIQAQQDRWNAQQKGDEAGVAAAQSRIDGGTKYIQMLGTKEGAQLALQNHNAGLTKWTRDENGNYKMEGQGTPSQVLNTVGQLGGQPVQYGQPSQQVPSDQSSTMGIPANQGGGMFAPVGPNTTQPQIPVNFNGAKIKVDNPYINRASADARAQQTSDTTANESDLVKDNPTYEAAIRANNDMNVFKALNEKNKDVGSNAINENIPNTDANAMKRIADQYTAQNIKQSFTRATQTELQFLQNATISPTAGYENNKKLLSVLQGVAQDQINYHELHAALARQLPGSAIDILWNKYKQHNQVVDQNGNIKPVRFTPTDYFSAPRVNSSDDYNSLPKGSKYIDSNGDPGVKS